MTTAPREPKPEEVWAARIIARELGASVVHHDDGTGDSRYDLRVGSAARPTLAVEVTGAVDPVWTETWNRGPARGFQDVRTVRGQWAVHIQATARLNDLEPRLPRLFAALDDAGIQRTGGLFAFQHRELARELEQLGIERIDRISPDGPGRYWLTMDGSGGAVDSSGSTVPEWIGSFLRDDRRADNLRKLERSGAAGRDMFVAVTLSGAPWSVVSYLTNISQIHLRLLSNEPDLPSPVTGVWITATLSFGDPVGVRWDGSRWSTFRTRGAGIDDADVA